MNTHQPHDAGRLHWSRGGWFGSQIGATAWLVLLGGLVIAQGRVEGVVVVGLGLLPNVVGFLMWHRRHRLSPYPALQLLIATAGISALLSMLILWRTDGSEAVLQLPSSLRYLLLYPALMLVFHLQERAGRKAEG
jgi:hypothetical protein